MPKRNPTAEWFGRLLPHMTGDDRQFCMHFLLLGMRERGDPLPDNIDREQLRAIEARMGPTEGDRLRMADIIARATAGADAADAERAGAPR